MIIDLKTVLHGSRHFDFNFEPGWWKNAEENDQILGLVGPLKGRIKISQSGSKYLLEGRVAGRLRIRCDRCLEPYDHDIASDFQLSLAMGHSQDSQQEIELLEDDMSIDFVAGDDVSLDDIVRGQIYLALPIKCLCRPDCSGLCPFCGVNLNVESCKCRRPEGHPGFSKLKNIKFEGA